MSKMKHNVDIDQIIAWSAKAGEMALARFRHVGPMTKDGGELVTLADREIETFLIDQIRATYPQDRIIGEEWGTQGGSNSRLWAIDPIDGTRSFISGLPVWGISLGVIQAGQPDYGVLYLPVPQECYTVEPVGPARLNREPLPMLQPQPWDRNALLCVPSDAHRRYDLNFGGITRSLGSTAAHIAYVARGTAVGALIRAVHIWDIAAALAILYRVGGGAWYLDGTPVQFASLCTHDATTKPFIAAHPTDRDALLGCIRTR